MENKEGFKFLGLLFGAALWIETTDEKTAKLAEEHLETLSKRSKKLDELELEEEMQDFARPNSE